jgi:hypothetical protein
MNKEQIFVSGIKHLLGALKKIDTSLVTEDYSSKLYPFSENLEDVIKDVEAWYADELSKLPEIRSKAKRDHDYFQTNKEQIYKRIKNKK